MGAWRCREKRNRKGRRREEGEGEENLEEPNGPDGRKTEMENKERDILIEGAIVALGRNQALEKFQGIQKDDPS